MKKNWQFKLDGKDQIVTLIPSSISNKLTIKVNGNISGKYKGPRVFTSDKKYSFKIEDRIGAIVTSTDKMKTHYDLTIENISVTTGQYKPIGVDRLKGVKRLSLILTIVLGIWLTSVFKDPTMGMRIAVILSACLSYWMIFASLALFTTSIKEFTESIDYQNLAKVGVTPTEQAPIPTFKDKMASVLSTATSTGMALMENAVPGSSNLVNANSEQALQPVDETPAPAIHVSESRIDNAAAAVGGAALVVGAAAIGYKVVKGLGKGGSRTISSTTRSASRTINAAKSASNVVSSQKARQKQQAKQAAQRQHQASLQKQKELERQKNKRHQQQVERLERERLERERMQNRDYPSREEELDIAAELGQLHDEHPDQW